MQTLRWLLNQLNKCLVWGSLLGSLVFGTGLGNSSTPYVASFLPVCYSTPNRMACALAAQKPSGLAPDRVQDTQELAVFPREMLLFVACHGLSVAALTSTSFCCFLSCTVLAKPLRFCWSSSGALFVPLVDLKSVQRFKLVQKAVLFWTKLNSTRYLKAIQAILEVVWALGHKKLSAWWIL